MRVTLSHEEVVRLQTVNANRVLKDDSFTKTMVEDCLIEYRKMNGVRIPGNPCICEITTLGKKLLRENTPVFVPQGGRERNHATVTLY